MRINKNIWIMIGLGSIIFHMYLIFSGLIPNLVSRPIHMAFAIPWIFLYSENKNFVQTVGDYCPTLDMLYQMSFTMKTSLLLL